MYFLILILFVYYPGGNWFGLFMGFSFSSFIEMLFWIFICCKDLRKKDDKPKEAEEKSDDYWIYFLVLLLFLAIGFALSLAIIGNKSGKLQI